MNPLVEKTGTSYLYCYQNPVKFVDPDGKQGSVPIVTPLPIPPIPTYQQCQNFSNGMIDLGKLIKKEISNLDVYLAAYIATIYVINKPKIDGVTGIKNTSELNKNIPTDPRWVRKQEKAAEKWGAKQLIKHDKMIQDNLPDPNLDDGGGPKRKLTPKELIVIGTTIGSGIIEQMTNPDPSMDAHDAHMEYIQDKKQDPNKKNIYWINSIKNLDKN